MENQVLRASDNPSSVRALKITIKILSAYPLLWTVMILIGGYFQFHPLIYLTMITWMFATYIGSLLWVIFVIYLLEAKKMSWKEAGIQFLLAITGIILAYYVAMYDVFDNGVKYID